MDTVNVPKKNLELALLGLRLGVALVLVMWGLDKLFNPGHTAAVFKAFYAIDSLNYSISYILGAIQLAIVVSFIVGFQKRWVTLLLLIMHLVSTLVSAERYFAPWSNLLFFAAWPMLAALFTLYVLRDFDTRFSISNENSMEIEK